MPKQFRHRVKVGFLSTMPGMEMRINL
jgi:hypothetical protein